MANTEALIQSVKDLLDVLVELYLGSFVKPFLQFHDEFQTKLHHLIRNLLDDNHDRVPEWLTANLIAYARMVLAFPTIIFLAWGHCLIPSFLVLAVDLLGSLDSVVIKFWVAKRRDLEDDATGEDENVTHKACTPSDDESIDNYEFEVVTTGSPQRMKSWTLTHKHRSNSTFLGIVCDEAFLVSCWIHLLSTILSGRNRSIKFFTLWWLIVSEVANGCLQFKTFYSNGGNFAHQLEGAVSPSDLINDGKLGSLKRSLELVGTALFILPFLRLFGVILLLLACPLAYESYRRKSKTCVIYVVCTKSEKFDFKIIKFWNQAKSLGSKLIVGVVGKSQTDMVCNACATACVDEVIAEAPVKADLMFLERQRIDRVVFMSNQTGLVTEEVIAAGTCLVLCDDYVVRPMQPKLDSKKV